MLRISGRGADGLAKAISTDNNGAIQVSGEKLSQIERSSKLTSGLINEFYYHGDEKTSISDSYKIGNGSIAKLENYIQLTLNANPTRYAEQGVRTTDQLEMDEYSSLYVEYEFTGSTQYDSRVSFSVGTNINGGYQNFVLEKQAVHKGTAGKVRNILKLNINKLKGKHYIKVHLVDAASTVSVPAELKVYAIWGERLQPKNLTSAEETLKVDSQIERAVKLSSGLLSEFYQRGVEVSKFSESYISGTGSLSKGLEYIYMNIASNPSNYAERGVITSEKIPLNEYAYLYMEYEFNGSTHYENEVYLSISNNASGGYQERTKYVRNIHKGIDGLAKGILKLSVADVLNAQYIRCHLVDTSSVVSVPAELKIHAVWGERIKPASLTSDGGMSTSIKGKDYHTGNPIEITAIQDDNNKGALYVVDASPYGYHPESESIRTSGSQLYKLDSLSKTEALIGEAKLDTDVIFVDNLRHLFILVDAQFDATPFEVSVNYYLSNKTTKIKTVVLEEVTSAMNLRGTSIKYSVECPFISITVKNKTTNPRTITLETYGG